MNHPVKCAGRTYDISFERVHDALSPQYMGAVEHLKRQIIIMRAAKPEVEDDTLLHELLHIALDMAGHKVEEGVIESAATLLLGFLKDNDLWNEPDWWRELRDAERAPVVS